MNFKTKIRIMNFSQIFTLKLYTYEFKNYYLHIIIINLINYNNARGIDSITDSIKILYVLYKIL